MIFASVLLGASPESLYKAETLVRSLTSLGGLAPSSVIVHTRSGLDDGILAPLRETGCRVNSLATLGDGACGDLMRQLGALHGLADGSVEGYWLLSLDLAVTAALRSVSQDAVAGEVSDRAPLALDAVESIFQAAGVAMPPTIFCDGRRVPIVCTQLDTSMLYIPARIAEPLRCSLTRFEPLIRARSEIASDPCRDRYILELSLAFALASLQVPVLHLCANDIFPLEAESLPVSYDPQKIVRALRIGAVFDAFGLVSSRVRDPALEEAVSSLNALIAQPTGTPYFGFFKRAEARAQRVPALPGNHEFEIACAQCERAFPHRLKLVLHAGTAKTGTKALQGAFYDHVDELAERGVWYPLVNLDPRYKKHQFLVAAFLAGDGAMLATLFKEIVRSAPSGTRTIVLSTEGLFQHWWDFVPESKAMIRHLTSLFDVELWVCFREPVTFAASQYAQLLRNPRQFSPAYGLDVGLDEMLEIEWFKKHLDYVGFVYDVEELIGIGNVRAFRYGSDIVQRMFHAVGAPAFAATAKRVNPSLRRPGVELMRIVNRYDLQPEQKEARRS
jgi:hypothetical protein